MNKATIFLFFISSLFISNCSDENITNPIDSELAKNIIGTWKGNSGYSITFYNNGFFIDSTYFEENPDTSDNHDGLFIRTGKYNISNSVLTYTEFNFSEIITSPGTGMAFIALPAEISITNNVLKRKPFSLFYNIGNGRNELWDKWESSAWFCQSDEADSSQNIYGTINDIYYFIEDSIKCFHTSILHNLVNDSTYTYDSKRNFTYDPPYLDLPVESDYNILVKFRNNNMYWYHDYAPEDLVKIE